MAVISSSWTKTTINSACRVGDGAHGSLKRYDNGIMYLTSKNFKADGLDLSKVDYIDENTYRKYFRENSNALTKPSAGDVLCSIIGSIGSPYLVKVEDQFGISSSVAILRPDQSKVLPKFLFYWIKGQTYQDALYGIKGGVAQGYVSLEMIRSLPLHYPALPIQRKIADVLSAYDDLIEVNTRRIRILEQMAQSVYREWFGKVEEGSLPEGWEISKLSNITTKIGSGATPLGGENAYKTSGISLIRSLNVYDFNFTTDNLAFIDDEQAGKLNNVTVKDHDILLNLTGASVARCCMVPSYILPARVNQHVSIIRVNPNLSNAFFVLYTINSESKKRELLNLAQGGATREALTKTTLENFKIVQPQRPLIEKFGKFAEDIFLQQEILKKKNANLRRTRDLLLPRLVSGEVVVHE